MVSLNVFIQDSSIWDMKSSIEVLEQFIANYQNKETEPLLNIDKNDEWKFILNLITLFNRQQTGDILGSNTDWSTEAVGSFFIKNLDNFRRKCRSSEGLEQLHQSFSVPKQNLSLPLIAFLYSTKDFKTYGKISLNHFFKKEFTAGVGQSLKSCSLKLISEENGNEAKSFLNEKIKFPKFLQPSPCLNISKYPQCSKYCNWHNRYFNDWPKDEFNTLMKFALPQRKISLSSTQPEIALAKRLFGGHTKDNLNHTIAPFSLILFCYQRSKGFVGDDIGIYAKACNKFFPTPTDQGICLTRNMDIKELIHVDKNYDSLFESNQQSSNEHIEDGTYGSNNILVVYTGASNDVKSIEQTNFRSSNVYDSEILFKFHQSKEISQFLEDRRLDLASPSLKLKAGMEYFVDIIPQVTETTEAFKKMDFRQRNCKLPHEVEVESIFKIYTKENCKYECNIKKAEETCKCIPWDFLHKNGKSQECDIFGRTCFYNAMNEFPKVKNSCDHCMKECDYTIYETILTNEKSLLLEYSRDSDGNTRLFETHTIGGDSDCTGDTIFCEYFWPNSTRFFDDGLDQSFLSMNGNRYKFQRSYMASDLVIIHWRILKPQINVVDAKYSLLDKFANFGGNFGIFAEITGCSFLGMMNFIILVFKLIFSKFYKKY